MPSSQAHREELRRLVRGHLADRPAGAFEPESIARGLRRELDCSANEVRDALHFLHGLNPPQVLVHHESLGASKYYQISSAGTLAHERGE